MSAVVNAGEEVELIIFDCDGVLIDSEIISCRVDAEALRCLGIPMSTEEVIRRFSGVSQKDMREIIERETQRPLPVDHDECVAERVRQVMATELVAMPAVDEVLQSLDIAYCVASSSTHDKLRFTLELTNLYHLLAPNIFSSSEVARGKPAPDLFLYAAQRMGVRADCCLVVEDSAAGIEAAKAAGMRAVGFVGGSHCTEEYRDHLRRAGAETIIDDLRHLKPV